MQNHAEFDAFVETIAQLRAPVGGCPWNCAQTHASIASNMIEEAYEAVDCIEKNDSAHLREELGDVLLQVVLQSQIAADAGEFTIDDVCRDINDKMIRRHPHVFADISADDANDVSALWEQVKLAEKQAKAAEATGEETLLDGIPVSFPALLQTEKISRKAAAAGFEWDTIDDVWDKVAEERAELEEAYAAAPKSADGRMVKTAGADNALVEATELEFGDLLFALVNVARRMGIDSEEALRASCSKFRRRWAQVEAGARNQGRAVEDLSQPEMEALWQKAKETE